MSNVQRAKLAAKPAPMRHGSVGCELLVSLFEKGESQYEYLFFDAKRRMMYEGKKTSAKACDVALGRCIKKGWILRAKREGVEFIKLTKEGELHALLACLGKNRSSSRNRARNRDHSTLWLALFDIPEAARRVRDFLRRFLLMIGFSQLQKSVYITSSPISEETFSFLERSGLKKFIRFMRVVEVEHIQDILELCRTADTRVKNGCR